MKSNQSLISIITPTYNQEKFIAQCLESVQKQTFQSWEQIVIDDCSTDKTYKIIRKYQKKDKRIKLICHKTNWGIKRLKETYNQALKLARGKYIAILEGDDFWPEYKLEIQIKAFKKMGVVLTYGDWVLSSFSGKRMYVRRFARFNKQMLNNNPPPHILNLFLTLWFDIASSTVMISKNTLEKIGGFKSDKNYPFVVIPTYLYLSKEGKFAYIPKILGYYRRTPTSAWFSFVKSLPTVGRENVQKCINSFVKNQTKNFSQSLDWEEILKAQKRYLWKRRLFYPVSVLFNFFYSKY